MKNSPPPNPKFASPVFADKPGNQDQAATLLSQLLHALPLAFLSLDDHHRITAASKQATEDFWDLPPARLKGLSLQAFFSRAGYPDLYEPTLKLLEEAAPQQIAFFAHRQQKWIAIRAIPATGGFLVCFSDITAQQKQQEMLLRHQSLLQLTEALMPMGSWEYDVPGNILTWSAGMYRLFDLPPETPVSPEIYLQYASRNDRPRARLLLQHMRQEPQSFDEILRINCRGRRKTLRIRSMLIPDQQGRPARLLGLDLDISAWRGLQKESPTQKIRQQKALMLAIQEAQETERKRIAEGLHNSVGQLLYATKLNLDQITAENPQSLAEYKDQADHCLLEAISETRRISHELMPGVLRELGLQAAVEDIGHRLSNANLDLQCRVYPMAHPLETYLQLAIYRIAQELANNIVRHARASRASIQIRQQEHYIALLAEDNGIGFELQPGPVPGMGLKVIQDRVKLLNGFMEIDSRPEQGTLISIYLPLETER